MRVLILHNRYAILGGEDSVVHSEAEMLRKHDVEVELTEVENPDPQQSGIGKRVRAGVNAAWSREAASRIAKVCRRFRPDIAHVHNFWLTLSPSVHAACRRSGAASVQTLHNLRLLCLNPCCVRDGERCEDCLDTWPWRGVVRRCYRQSLGPSAAVALMVVANRVRGTWHRDVDAYIALTEFSRARFARTLPADRLFAKPNFVEDPGPPRQAPSASNVVVYAGRLSAEKSVGTLLSAWSAARLDGTAQLHIYGDGPETDALMRHAGTLGLREPEVVFAGRRPTRDILRAMSSARAVVVPSGFGEQFPRVVVEAYASGRPVITSDFECMAEIVQHGEQGLNFAMGQTAAFEAALRCIIQAPELADRLGQNARTTYLARYTPARNAAVLMDIYRFALHRRAGASA